MEKVRILITGGTGFIGSFIVEKAVELGWEVFVAVREKSNKKHIKHLPIHYVSLTLTNKQQLLKEIQQVCLQAPFDYIIHAAGATQAKNEEAFMRVNYEGTKNLCEALIQLALIPKKFVFLSSLSILGPVAETPNKQGIYPIISEKDTPQPNTAYAKSKLKAEAYLKQLTNFPYVILRPTGVYGPRDKDYLLLIKSLQKHLSISAGLKPQTLSFVYVKDLVQATFLALTQSNIGKEYFVSDGKAYTSQMFNSIVQKELSLQHVYHLKLPLWLLYTICWLNEKIALCFNQTATLNTDKYHLLKQRNWQCSIEALQAIGYKPVYDLESGLKETLQWYKTQNLI